MKNAPSIVYYEDRCAVCGSRVGLEKHHIFYGTANRKLADKDGLTVMLCAGHHRGSPNGVHGGNTKLDLELKATAQAKWMEYYGLSEDDFRSRYGKSWLE